MNSSWVGFHPRRPDPALDQQNATGIFRKQGIIRDFCGPFGSSDAYYVPAKSWFLPHFALSSEHKITGNFFAVIREIIERNRDLILQAAQPNFTHSNAADGVRTAGCSFGRKLARSATGYAINGVVKVSQRLTSYLEDLNAPPKSGYTRVIG